MANNGNPTPPKADPNPPSGTEQKRGNTGAAKRQASGEAAAQQAAGEREGPNPERQRERRGEVGMAPKDPLIRT